MHEQSASQLEYGDILLGFVGIMEKKMETTIMGYIGYRLQGMWGCSLCLRLCLLKLVLGLRIWDIGFGSGASYDCRAMLDACSLQTPSSS